MALFRGAASLNPNLGSWYIPLIDLAVSNDERIVTNIMAQNQVLTSHNPTCSVTDTHAYLFEVAYGTTLRLKPGLNVTLGTAYQVNVTAAGPNLFGGIYHRVVGVAAEPVNPLIGVTDHIFVTTWTTDRPYGFPSLDPASP